MEDAVPSPNADAPDAPARVVMIYNADGGIANALLDAAHKLLRPSTYPCSLCAITHGAVSMRADWKRVIAALGVPVAFLHRDEWTVPAGLPPPLLPAIVAEHRDGRWRTLLDGPAIDACADVPALEAALGATLRSAIDS